MFLKFYLFFSNFEHAKKFNIKKQKKKSLKRFVCRKNSAATSGQPTKATEP